MWWGHIYVLLLNHSLACCVPSSVHSLMFHVLWSVAWILWLQDWMGNDGKAEKITWLVLEVLSGNHPTSSWQSDRIWSWLHLSPLIQDTLLLTDLCPQSYQWSQWDLFRVYNCEVPTSVGNTCACMSMQYLGGMIKILKSCLITPNTLLMTFWAFTCRKLNNSSGVVGLWNSGDEQLYNDN